MDSTIYYLRASSRIAPIEGHNLSCVSIACSPQGDSPFPRADRKFAANPTTAIASMSVPFCTGPGRSEFERQLSTAFRWPGNGVPIGFNTSLFPPTIASRLPKQYTQMCRLSISSRYGAIALLPLVSKKSRSPQTPKIMDVHERLMDSIAIQPVIELLGW
jgi:hypothetical protein